MQVHPYQPTMAKKQKDNSLPFNTQKQKAAEAVRIAIQLIDTWDKFTRQRFNDIQEKEENYFGKVRPRTSGRSNFPVPVLARYVDEIKSRLDESPSLKYDSQVSISRKLIGKKATAIIKNLKKPQKGNWNKYDRNSRNLALFAGYNAVDFYSEDNDGEFSLVFDPIDHYEFVFEAGGGNDLEKHSGVGRFPMFRTESQVKSRGETGLYDAKQVEKLIARYNGSDFRKHDEFFKNKFDRYKALGIDIQNNDYIGQKSFALAQIQMTIDFGNGAEKYMVTFDYGSGIWVRFQPLKEVFPSGLYSIDLWQTHEDQSNVMCKSPIDDIWPLAELIRVKVNQLTDNHTARIYGQRGYDPNFIPDPSQLPWKMASQLVKMKSYNGKPISQGIYEFKTEDMTGSTIEFIKWVDDFLTSVVGINPNDVSDEVQKVGILFGQIQKTAARMGIYNKSFREMWERIGSRALWEMKQHLKEKQTIQIIGTKGAEWHEFVGSELENPSDFDILAEGSNVELEMSEARKKMQNETLSEISSDQIMQQQVNPRWMVEKKLKAAEFPDEEIKQGMDVENYGNEDQLSRADLACEEILKKKYTLDNLPKDPKSGMPTWDPVMKPKLYEGAEVAFMQYILDFAGKLDDDEAEARIALMSYGRAHIKIVVKNMANKALNELSTKGITPDKVQQPLPPGVGPAGGPGQQGQQQQAPGPRAPSPAIAQHVSKRGAKPLGHMPIPKVGQKGRKPTPTKK